ncbi:LOW QUALITY PROTEIN: uncharacterized protein EMH_0022170 [Eimeria mitis]|uniref:Uncharacterized protein n=1 Tax=Eimeria mitis TaxID=44415 RepID=U6K9Z4_9EIME|nr:LOW QUALITY PROTEIN: uncharacterized protein EMH_0022170 [Eimeria mitis]CDJ34784.1 hypothetical protein EMH_0022170 [Eimeria mitis]
MVFQPLRFVWVSVAPSIEQRLSGVGSMHKGKRIPQKYSDGWEPTAKKIGKPAYFGSVETAAEDQSSAVQRLRETAQQPAATSTGFRLVEFSAVPTNFSHQQGLAPSLVDLQGAQHVQLAAPAVVQPSPTIARQASSSLSAASTTPTFETFRYPKEASVHQSVGVAAGQSGSLAPQGHSPHRSTEVSTRLVKLRTLLVPGASNSSSSKHPFVRAPMLMPDVRIEDVEDRIPESLISKDSSVFLLKAVRSLCLKPALDLREANELVRAAISLARRALASMTTPVDKVKPSVAAEALGRRFLVFDAFHRVLKLTGDIKDDLRGLWQALVTKVPTTYARPLRGIYNEDHVFYHTLSRQLSAALELYKNGSSPSEDEILDLKRKLFCTDFSPRGFLRQSWDVWRLDDINFTGTP